MYYWGSVISGGIVVTCVLICSIFVYFWSKDECHEGTLPCTSGGGTCVPHKNVCDGHHDCPNRQDEDPALCFDWTGSVQMIRNAHNRSKIENPDYHKTGHICELDRYPEFCRCTRRHRITCRDLGLMQLPLNISPNVTHLNLANNSITTLSSTSLVGYPALKVIHFEGNGLRELPPGVFRGQKDLRRLLLMRNSITRIEKGAFEGLGGLLWLILRDNLVEFIEMEGLNELESVEWIDLSRNKLMLSNESFPSLRNLLELDLGYNRIVRITGRTFPEFPNLELLNLRRNDLSYIESTSFVNLASLRELNLYGNRLIHLEDTVFHPLRTLERLYLGDNPNLTHIPSQLFAKLQELASLNLEGIKIENIDVTTFSQLHNLVTVYFKSYRYCAYAPRVPHCRPLSDGISSASRLLDKPSLRLATWTIAFLSCTGNVMVIWGRLRFHDENKVLGLLVRNLAASDLLMGIYLFIIGYQDLRFKDVYNLEAHDWMSSWSCTITGILAMTSSEVSVLLLVFMSVERVLLIAIPFGRYSYIRASRATASLLCIWTAGIALAVLPAIKYRSSTRFYGLNGLCFPLHLDDPYLLGWEYSAFVVLGVNAVGLLIITTAYCVMFISVWKTRHATTLPMKDFEFAIRFFFIVFTDATCWFPIILVKVLVLLGTEISADLYAWLVVFVLPINSAINPFLYTLTTPKYRSKITGMSLGCFRANRGAMRGVEDDREGCGSRRDTGSTPTACRMNPGKY